MIIDPVIPVGGTVKVFESSILLAAIEITCGSRSSSGNVECVDSSVGVHCSDEPATLNTKIITVLNQGEY